MISLAGLVTYIVIIVTCVLPIQSEQINIFTVWDIAKQQDADLAVEMHLN